MEFTIKSKKYGNKTVLVDDEMWALVENFVWYLQYCEDTKTFYVATSLKENEKYKVYPLHRMIMNNPINKIIDHINHNGLDNRISNLRVCSHSENMQHRKVGVKGSSIYKGVSLNKRDNLYYSAIKNNKITYYLGCFKKEIEAAACYDNYAKIFHGDFAVLNGVDNNTWCKAEGMK